MMKSKLKKKERMSKLDRISYGLENLMAVEINWIFPASAYNALD